MIHKVKIQPIGGALGAILPKDLLENIHIAQDDELLVVPANGGIFLMPYKVNFKEAMEAFEVGMEKYNQALRELAR